MNLVREIRRINSDEELTGKYTLEILCIAPKLGTPRLPVHHLPSKVYEQLQTAV
jgi:hypothetical protein